jgi:UDP-glucose 4-epimerase
VFTQSYGLETVSLRYFNVFGPRQDPGSQYSGVISRFILALENGERPTIYGDGEQTRDFTYVANAVEANLLAAQAPNASGKVFNVANGESTSINEVLGVLKSLTGRNELQAEHLPARAGDVRDSLADLESAATVLAYQPKVSLEDGLELTLEWWKTSRFNRTIKS